jgi:site-specific recombinase XerD
MFLTNNFRNRVFDSAVKRATADRVGADLTPLPERLTPHKLRHTFCSLLFAQGHDLPRELSGPVAPPARIPDRCMDF